jgi:hypothetical protein
LVKSIFTRDLFTTKTKTRTKQKVGYRLGDLAKTKTKIVSKDAPKQTPK